jgi:thiamine-phosphate pyrophosphorylase
MQFEFTPAAERALASAAGWTSSADVDQRYAPEVLLGLQEVLLGLPEVLLGLLDEPECRAALLLAKHGIDAAAVDRRFPGLTPLQPPQPQRAGRFSAALRASFEAAERLLIEHPRPLSLATEHVLLGIVATRNEVSDWLAECGLHADALEAEVHRLAGHQPGPLPIEPMEMAYDPLEADVTPRSAADFAAAETSGGPLTAHEQLGALRIVDAAANRAGEGLRVVEDYLRFVLDDQHLTRACKVVRHDLADALNVFSSSERHAARETQADVGTQVTAGGEQVRGDMSAVLQANFKRVEQSLRSLEEFAKLSAPHAAGVLEQLRYRVYTLERAVDITRTSWARLADARLCVLVDGCPSIEAFEEMVEALISAGASMIQLRAKKLEDRQLLERARRLRERTHASSTLFIMNDRPDLAVLAGADGVHLGQDDVAVKDARRMVGSGGLIGVSTHSIEQARQAVLDGANYIGVGPTFPSGTKQFARFTGPELLRAVVAEIRLPAFAIGGITTENLPQVMASGVGRIAVSGAVTGAGDPAAAAREILTALGRSINVL